MFGSETIFTIENTDVDRFASWLQEETGTASILGERIYNTAVVRDPKSRKVTIRLGESILSRDTDMLGIVLELIPLAPPRAAMQRIQVRAICSRSEARPYFEWLMTRIAEVWDVPELLPTEETTLTNRPNANRDQEIYQDKIAGKTYKEIAEERGLTIRRIMQIVSEQKALMKRQAVQGRMKEVKER